MHKHKRVTYEDNGCKKQVPIICLPKKVCFIFWRGLDRIMRSIQLRKKKNNKRFCCKVITLNILIITCKTTYVLKKNNTIMMNFNFVDRRCSSYGAFEGCTGLTKIFGLSGSIGDNAFNGCSGLTTIGNLSKVTSIGKNAFQGCTSLTYIDGLSGSIGDDAFRGCTGLLSIGTLSNVTSIGNGAFMGCTGLKNISIGHNNNDCSSKNLSCRSSEIKNMKCVSKTHKKKTYTCIMCNVTGHCHR